jgi:hypothetical protein
LSRGKLFFFTSYQGTPEKRYGGSNDSVFFQLVIVRCCPQPLWGQTGFWGSVAVNTGRLEHQPVALKYSMRSSPDSSMWLMESSGPMGFSAFSAAPFTEDRVGNLSFVTTRSSGR